MNTEKISQGKSSGTVVVGVSGIGQLQSIFDVSPGRSVRIDIPKNFTDDHFDLAARDIEILGEILKSHSSECCQIVNAVNAGNFKDAQKIAEQINLTEKNFISQGGGIWGLILFIAVVAAVSLEHD